MSCFFSPHAKRKKEDVITEKERYLQLNLTIICTFDLDFGCDFSHDESNVVEHPFMKYNTVIWIFIYYNNFKEIVSLIKFHLI